jgi:hypothetical protein
MTFLAFNFHSKNHYNNKKLFSKLSKCIKYLNPDVKSNERNIKKHPAAKYCFKKAEGIFNYPCLSQSPSEQAGEIIDTDLAGLWLIFHH